MERGRYSPDGPTLKSILESPLSTIKDILLPEFVNPIIWNHTNLPFISFVLKNIQQVTDYALRINPLEKWQWEISVQLICPRDPELLEILKENADLTDILYNYSLNIKKYSESSINTYFNLLPRYLCCRNVNDKFKSPSFLMALFDNIDIGPCFYFLNYYIIAYLDIISPHIKEIPLFKILMNGITTESNVIKERSQIIFINLISFGSIENWAKLLMENNILNTFIEKTLKTPTYSSFNFIINLYNTALSHRYVYISFKDAKYDCLCNLIENYFDQFCVLIFDYSFYNKTLSGCCKLSLSIEKQIKHKLTNSYLRFLKQLSKMFFEFPQNNELHEMFYQNLLYLGPNNLLSDKIIEEMNLVENIINCYKSRETNIVSAFWGHLRLISNTINRKSLKPNMEWQNIVMKENKRREMIIQKDYGGANGSSSWKTSIILPSAALLACLIVIGGIIFIVYRSNL